MLRFIIYLLILTAFFLIIRKWTKQDKKERELREAQKKKDQLAVDTVTVEIEKENKKTEEKLEKEKEKLEMKTD